MNKKIRALIISESESNNLGDRAITYALSYMLESFCEVGTLSLTDVAKFDRQQSVAFKTKNVIIKMARALSPKFKARIRWWLLGERKRTRIRYQSQICKSDVVLVGGGQLIKNNVALFCERIALIGSITRDYKIPLVLIGVGVDQNMNKLTWSIVQRSLYECSHIAVRDEGSKDRITVNANGATRPSVVPDLGFSLLELQTSLSDKVRNIDIAINVMDFSAMLAQTRRRSSITKVTVISWLCEFAACACRKNLRIAIFTSGDSSDLTEAKKVKVSIEARIGLEVPVFHPETVEDLGIFLSDVKDVVAMRMHAGILAYVFGCNPVCLVWDDKVRGVWASIGESTRLIELNDFSEAGSYLAVMEKLTILRAPPENVRAELAESIRKAVATIVESVHRKRTLSDASNL